MRRRRCGGSATWPDGTAGGALGSVARGVVEAVLLARLPALTAFMYAA